jgi:hypothetical protein
MRGVRAKRLSGRVLLARLNLAFCWRVRSLSSARVELANDPTGRAVKNAFATRRAGWPPLASGRWGRAAVNLPTEPEAYSRGRSRQALRTNRTRALELGYQPCTLDPRTYATARHACYRSTEIRQGAPVTIEMWPFDGEPDDSTMLLSGCRDRSGELVAVSRILVSGELAWIRNLVGHADHLDSGVMYLLVEHCVERIVAEHGRHKQMWLLLDGYFDGSPGLRYFMQRIGMSPWNIRFSLAKTAG